MNNAVEEGGNNMKRLIFALSLASPYPYTYYEPSFSFGLPFFYFHVQ